MNMKPSLIISIVTLLVSQSYSQQEKNDSMCNVNREILCVKDVLISISKITHNIDGIINETHKYISDKISDVDTIDRYIKYQVSAIDVQLPPPKYHVHFFRVNNINKKYLILLLVEAHDAMSFYYNSIGDIINLSNISLTNTKLQRIQHSLRSEFICQYRNILNVYSTEWKTIDQITRLEFSKMTFHIPLSILHDAHATITIDLLRTWMDRIRTVIQNIEMKFV